jgi:hypothetical protein
VVTRFLGPALIALVGACSWPATDALQVAKITNGTESRVIVYIDYPDIERDFMTLSPGGSDFTDFSGPDGCAPQTLIARTSSGDEVARREQPFCVGDTWTIQAESDSN